MNEAKLRTVILSGLSYSGKSHYLAILNSLEAFSGFACVSADYFRSQILGDRWTALAEQRVFREAVWFEIKKNLVIGRGSVILEMVLKTQRDHWRPLTTAVQDAFWHLRDFTGECRLAGKEETHSYDVHLKAITLFNDLESLERRIQRRLEQVQQKGNVTGTNIFDLKSFSAKSGINVFELPTLRQSLYIDTSDESPEAVEQNIREITEFVFENKTTADQELRCERAELFLNQLKSAAVCA